jgi:putative SOS response-associated peptidase YedK
VESVFFWKQDECADTICRFNEGEEVGSKMVQWAIDPGDGIPRGLVFLWRRFEIEGAPALILACVMVTVPASNRILAITGRMPAILDDADWPKWLGEDPASPSDVKAVLKRVEGVNWQIREDKNRNDNAICNNRERIANNAAMRHYAYQVGAIDVAH